MNNDGHSPANHPPAFRRRLEATSDLVDALGDLAFVAQRVAREAHATRDELVQLLSIAQSADTQPVTYREPAVATSDSQSVFNSQSVVQPAAFTPTSAETASATENEHAESWALPATDPLPQHAPEMPAHHGAASAAQPTVATPPWWTQEKIVLRLIAIVGGVITTAGIIFLVAFAIQTGLLGPLGRVILAYVLAVGLAGAAYWAHRRQAISSAVTALAVTSQLTAHITTVAVVNVVGWWHGFVGVGLVFAVAIAGVLTARWRTSASQSVLSGIVGTGAMYSLLDNDAFAMLGAGLGAYLVTISVAGVMVYSWRSLPGIAVFISAFGLATVTALVFAAVVGNNLTNNNAAESVVAAIAIIAIYAIAIAYYLAVTMRKDLPQSNTVLLVRLFALPLACVSACIAGATQQNQGADYVAMSWLLVGSSALSLMFGVWGMLRKVDGFEPLRSSAFIGAIFPLLGVTGASVPPLAFILSPLAAAIFAWTTAVGKTRFGRTFNDDSGSYAWELGITASTLWLAIAHYNLFQFSVALFDPHIDADWLLSPAMLLLLVADAGVIRLAVLRRYPPWVGLVGLGIMPLPVMVLFNIAGVPFTFAHMLISVAWMVAAFALVLSPKLTHMSGNLGAALAVASIAVAKLIFFDMQTLDGIVRVAAFIVCGLLLLAMAVLGSKRRTAPR